MGHITYPLYRQRKALREHRAMDMGVIVSYAVLIGALLNLVITGNYGAGAMLFGAAWLTTNFLLDKHPSDITREQFDRASTDLEVVSLGLYSRVEDGSDYDGTPASERFYAAYVHALDMDKGTDLGEFYEAVRRAEHALREWNSAEL